MDQTELQQNIANYYAKLPVKLQGVFSGLKWMDDLKNIYTKYSLSEDQTETLATETTLVLLGIIHLEDYVLTLRKDLKLDEETFNKIIDDLDSGVLKDIKDDLVNTFELNVEFLNNENIKKEDEIPLPPYARLIKNNEKLITDYNLPITNENTEQKSINVPKNIFEGKLSSSTMSNHIVSNYSTVSKSNLPTKDNNLNSSVKKSDPYREEF